MMPSAPEEVSSTVPLSQQSGAIVGREIDQAGLLDEAAEFDQVSGAFASLHDPGSRIGACAGGFSAPDCRRRSTQRRLRR